LTTLQTHGAGEASAGEPAGREDALLARLRGGDAGAFSELVDRLHPTMLRVARAIARDGAEDVVQETWAAVIDSLDRFEQRSSLKTWIFRILTNRASSWAKRTRRFDIAHVVIEEANAGEPALDPARFTRWGNWASPPQGWVERSPEEIVLHMQAGAALAGFLDALPVAQRLVVTLRDLEGLSSSEVCDVLCVSDSNQRVLLHRGRSKLRAAMEQYLWSEPT
jgi:RNA polymerase sigma-70 factor (ECF subfamily)